MYRYRPTRFVDTKVVSENLVCCIPDDMLPPGSNSEDSSDDDELSDVTRRLDAVVCNPNRVAQSESNEQSSDSDSSDEAGTTDGR